MSTKARNDIALIIAATLTEEGYGAKVWHGDTASRVYVTRALSRRQQPMGYVEILATGERNYNGLERNKAGMRDRIEGADALKSHLAAA